MKKAANPFFLSGYPDDQYLCDRQELQTLKDLLPHNIVLYGRRRMGKTTLVKRLLAETEKAKEYDTLYVDLLATQNKEEAIAAIARAVNNKFSRSKSDNFQSMFLGVAIDYHPYTGKPIISKGPKSFTKTEKSLSALGQFLSQRKKRLVIALDEFQQISLYEEGNEEALFRGWVQQYPLISFIFIGSPPKMMTDMFAVKNRPFFQSARLVHLGPIALPVYSDFIKKQFAAKGRIILEKPVSDVYQVARGETFTIQMLCHRLISMSKTVKVDEVNRALSDFLDQQESTYADYARMLTRHQWSVFKAIAKEEPLYNPLGKDFIYKHNLGAASTVSTALKALEKLGLIIQEDGGYLVHDVLIGKWMARLI